MGIYMALINNDLRARIGPLLDNIREWNRSNESAQKGDYRTVIPRIEMYV